MGAIEPARQAGSTDTKLDQQLDHDGFAVGSLDLRNPTRVMDFRFGFHNHKILASDLPGVQK